MVDSREGYTQAFIIKPGSVLEILYKIDAKNLENCLEASLIYFLGPPKSDEKQSEMSKRILSEMLRSPEKGDFVFEIAEGGEKLISVKANSLTVNTRIVISDEENISIEERDKKELKKLGLSVLKVLLASKAGPKINIKNEAGKQVPEEKFTPAGERRMKVPARSHREFLDLITNNKYPLGRRVEIQPYTIEEVGKHDKEGDAWTVINNRIYDISIYLEYHPGGKEKLMMGAGCDGTALFNKYHAWVSVDSLLSKFQVGVLKYD